MKILEYGAGNQKKFKCNECGCVFVADKTDLKGYSGGTYVNWGEDLTVPEKKWEDTVYVLCPMCGNDYPWRDGENYDE